MMQFVTFVLLISRAQAAETQECVSMIQWHLPTPIPQFEPIVFEHVKRCEGPAISPFWTADICGYGHDFSAAECDPGNEVGPGAAGLQPNSEHTMGPLFKDDGELWQLHLQSNNVSVFTCPEGNGVTIDRYKQDAALESIRQSHQYPPVKAGVLTGQLRTAFWQSSTPGFRLKGDTEINFNFAQEHCSDSWSSFWMLGVTGTGKAGDRKPYKWVSHFEIDIIENYPMSHPDWPHTWAHNFAYCNNLGNTIPGLCEEKLLGDAAADGFVPPSKEPGVDYFERHVTLWVGEKDCPNPPPPDEPWGPGDMERYGCVRGRSCLDTKYDMKGKKCPTVFITSCAVIDDPKQRCEKDESKAAYHVYDVLPGDAINPLYDPGTGLPDPVYFTFVLDNWTPAAYSALAAQCVLTVNDLRIT